MCATTSLHRLKQRSQTSKPRDSSTCEYTTHRERSVRKYLCLFIPDSKLSFISLFQAPRRESLSARSAHFRAPLARSSKVTWILTYIIFPARIVTEYSVLRMSSLLTPSNVTPIVERAIPSAVIHNDRTGSDGLLLLPSRSFRTATRLSTTV